MSENKQYENEYKVQAVKLAKKIGAVNAANELQIPVNTLYGWIQKVKSHCAFRPRQPVYQCCVQSCYPKIRHCVEYEQCPGEDVMIMRDVKAFGQG